jgi:hypothetical protein
MISQAPLDYFPVLTFFLGLQKGGGLLTGSTSLCVLKSEENFRFMATRRGGHFSMLKEKVPIQEQKVIKNNFP